MITKLPETIRNFKLSNNEIEQFFFSKNLKQFLKISNENSKKVYAPVLKDLYYIYKTILHYKRINVLEFGCGYSSAIIKKALSQNKSKFKKINFSNLGFRNQFIHIMIDDQKKYMEITKKRNNKIKDLENIEQSYFFSKCRMTKFNDRICTEYENLPNFIPDFIYLDGPNLEEIKGSENGINFSKNLDFTPMSCDILKFENILLPGCIIIVDGRGSNVNFIKSNLYRNWEYFYNSESDQHFFKLNDKSVGPKNTNLKKFYNS